jgi:chromosome segregation ATPase
VRKTPANDSSPDTRESASTEEGFATEGDSKINDALEERGATAEGDPTFSSTTLEDLRRQKEATSQEIISIEAAHRNIVSQRRQHAKKLEEQQRILQGLSQQIDEVVSNVERTYQEYTALGEEMQSLTASKKAKLVALQGIDEKISVLSEVTIFVERSGSGFEISAEQMDKEYQLSDDGYDEIYKNLMESSNEESIQNLTLREIRVLAILIAVTKNLADIRYNVIIDAEEIENAFKACSLKVAK